MTPEQQPAGLTRWQSISFVTSTSLAAVSLALLIALVVWHLSDLSTLENRARDDGFRVAADAAAAINEGLTDVRTVVEDLAEELDSGALKDEGVEDRLLVLLGENPGVAALTVAYRPGSVPDFALRREQRLYAPFSQRNSEGALEIVRADDTYDYTQPDGSVFLDGLPVPTAWYLAPLESESLVWGEPYIGARTLKHWAGVGLPFYRPDSSTGESALAGIVDASLTLDEFQTLLAKVTLSGRSGAGYGFVVSGSGVFLAHPIEEFVTGSATLSDFDEDISIAGLERLFRDREATGGAISVDHVDERSGQEQWVFFVRVQSAGWWVGIVLDKERFIGAGVTDRLRRQQIGIALAAMALAFFTTVVLFRAYRGQSRGLWIASFAFSLLCVAGISYLWFINVTNPGATDERNIILADPATTEKVVADYARKIDNGIYIPTGIFVQSVEFSTANNVTVTGYVWQRYPADLPQRFAGIKPGPETPGFVFPEADSTSVSEVFRETQANGEEVIGWNFRAVLRQQFDYAKYPFDREDVWVRMWHKDFGKNVVLTPDLDSYPITDPSSRPGLEQQDFVLEDWDITESYFSYRDNEYNTNFGVEKESGLGAVPELYFNISLKRRFMNAFISNLIPVIVVAFLLFTVLLTIRSGREDGRESASGVLSFCAGLFFVVIIAHVNLRVNLAAQGVIYLELFYFLMYGAILSVAVNSIILASPNHPRFLVHQGNLIASLLYWPVVTALLLGFTLAAFM